MCCLLIIILVWHGFTYLSKGLKSFLCLSSSKPLLKLNFPPKLRFWDQMVVGNMFPNPLNLFCLEMVFSTNYLLIYPQKNGLVKRKRRHLIEITITFFFKSSIPSTFGSYAVHCCFSCQYFCLILFWTFLDISQLQVFGCAYYSLLWPYNSHKLDPRTKECIFLGYSTTSKGYLYFDPSSKIVYTSRYVLFNYTKFPYPNLISSSQSQSLWFSNLLYFHSLNQPSILGPLPFSNSIPSTSPSNSISDISTPLLHTTFDPII